MLTVLIADNEPAILSLYASVLEDEGFAVLTASNGAEALEVIRSEAPSVAVLDMRMPVMTGKELMAELERGGHSIPVVAFSASMEQLEAVRHQAAAVLVKPVRNAELVAAVREALSG